jgi:aminomethyltransferase
MLRQAGRLLPALKSAEKGLPAVSVVPAGQTLGQLLARHFADDANLHKTVLYDFHVENGGKMVPFAGYAMPIQYKDSIMESTKQCREHATLFDVSHMLGATLKGKDAVRFCEKLVVGDIAGIEDGSGSLSLLTNEKGGIIDDSVITKVNGEEIYLVLNAGCRDKDTAHINKHLEQFKGEGGKVDFIQHDDRSLLALQGPASHEVLQGLVKGLDLNKFYFSNFARVDVAGVPCWVTRTGYTGEDGFEISAPLDGTMKLTQALLEHQRVKLAGLGARDSLRLEAGLCLYGNDLNEDTTPIEAGLTWTIGKRRREAYDFVGGDVIKKQLAEGAKIRRVGFISKGAPARQHSEIQTPDGKKIGEITSGAFSPCLKKNIAMGYVEKPYGKAGTELKVVVRGKTNDAVVTKMPFVKTTYYKQDKTTPS